MKSTINFGYLIFLSVVAALGGFLFGYDTAVISGTIAQVTQLFQLDTLQQGWYVGCALIGSIVGVLFAGILSDKLGLKNAFAFDLQAACCGFLYLMETAASLIASGRHKKIIIVGADKMSSMVNYQDRATCPIFGDGAAACMVEATTEDYGIMDSILRTDGKGLPFLHMKAGGSVCPPSYFTVDHKMHYLYQEGRTVFKYAVSNMSDITATIAEKNGLNKDNIDWVIPHQANLRIIDAVASRLEVPLEKVMINIQRYGNTSGATLPLCLWDYEKQLKKGDNLIFTAFGAGFTYGAVYVKWGYDGSKR